MKFRKKPIVIDATQFRVVDLSTHTHVNWGDPAKLYMRNKYWVQTLEGPLIVKDGDWIITGIKGEHYPCKPDIFEATYEKVDE